MSDLWKRPEVQLLAMTLVDKFNNHVATEKGFLVSTYGEDKNLILMPVRDDIKRRLELLGFVALDQKGSVGKGKKKRTVTGIKLEYPSNVPDDELEKVKAEYERYCDQYAAAIVEEFGKPKKEEGKS